MIDDFEANTDENGNWIGDAAPPVINRLADWDHPIRNLSNGDDWQWQYRSDWNDVGWAMPYQRSFLSAYGADVMRMAEMTSMPRTFLQVPSQGPLIATMPNDHGNAIFAPEEIHVEPKPRSTFEILNEAIGEIYRNYRQRWIAAMTLSEPSDRLSKPGDQNGPGRTGSVRADQQEDA